MMIKLCTVAVLVVIGVFLIIVSRSAPLPTAKPDQVASASPYGDPITSSFAPTLSLDDPAFDEPLPSVADARAAAIDKVERSLELYRETRVYPPWSRPADGSTEHLIAWNEPWPTGQPFAADKDKREIRADVSLDRLFAGPGEPLVATLGITYVDTGTPVVPEVLQARVEWYDDDGDESRWRVAAEILWVSTGGQYTARFVPSKIGALADGPVEARLVTHVRIGEFPKDLVQQFQYASEPALVVHRMAGERIDEQGSLEVLLDVDVQYAAPTLVQAALFDRTGTIPIAIFDDYVRPDRTGRQQIAVRFFGKSIHDRGVDGPYRIRALHGHVRVPGAQPEEVFWSHRDDPKFVTRVYAAAQFRGDDWSSPEKDDKIASYKRALEDLTEGR